MIRSRIRDPKDDKDEGISSTFHSGPQQSTVGGILGTGTYTQHLYIYIEVLKYKLVTEVTSLLLEYSYTISVHCSNPPKRCKYAPPPPPSSPRTQQWQHPHTNSPNRSLDVYYFAGVHNVESFPRCLLLCRGS
jgi:hypothetical protein